MGTVLSSIGRFTGGHTASAISDGRLCMRSGRKSGKTDGVFHHLRSLSQDFSTIDKCPDTEST